MLFAANWASMILCFERHRREENLLADAVSVMAGQFHVIRKIRLRDGGLLIREARFIALGHIGRGSEVERLVLTQ